LLCNPEVVVSVRLDSESNWSAQSLLKLVCNSPRNLKALIDIGGLLTGMSNFQVAEFILKHTSPFHLDGVVYFTENDQPFVLLRRDQSTVVGGVVPLSQCGLDKNRRFTYYDHIHRFGVDIPQSPTACAAVFVGKDSTLRDYSQGCWRMRGLGIGQTLEIFVVPQVVKLIHENSSSSSSSITLQTLLEWLVKNELRGLRLQHNKLISLHERGKHREPTYDSSLFWEETLKNIPRDHFVELLHPPLRDTSEFDVKIVEGKDSTKQHFTLLSERNEQEQGNLDMEVQNEKEREQEQEQETEPIMEVKVKRAYSGVPRVDSPWPLEYLSPFFLSPLQETPHWKRLSSFSLPLFGEKLVPLSLFSSVPLFATQNHTPFSLSAEQARKGRLKNVFVLLRVVSRIGGKGEGGGFLWVLMLNLREAECVRMALSAGFLTVPPTCSLSLISLDGMLPIYSANTQPREEDKARDKEFESMVLLLRFFSGECDFRERDRQVLHKMFSSSTFTVEQQVEVHHSISRLRRKEGVLGLNWI